MIRFECDYAEGAHPAIMDMLIKTNLEQTPGYGEDHYSDEARTLIRDLCKDDTLAVHFLVGGTQTNFTVISAALRPYEGVLCAETGHINVHETGAVEATGHKVLPLKSCDGKIDSAQIETAVKAQMDDEAHEHLVKPGMVYISQPTECGTMYTCEELKAISEVCQRYDIYLFVDGARLGYALASPQNNITLKDMAELTDIFYIGGTKVGLLFGEAVVIRNEELKKNFRYMIKQKGGMLAKGRLLGVQFGELMKDGLYIKISEEAVRLAMQIKKAFLDKGIKFLYDSPTNQQFPILSTEQIGILKREFAFSDIKDMGNGLRAVRFCTSWATREGDVDKLLNEIAAL